jgi:NADH:ubiquinone oxidoreductase subunit 3 (subunit A)
MYKYLFSLKAFNNNNFIVLFLLLLFIIYYCHVLLSLFSIIGNRRTIKIIKKARECGINFFCKAKQKKKNYAGIFRFIMENK